MLITEGKNTVTPVAHINGWTNVPCEVRSLKQSKNSFYSQSVCRCVYFLFIYLFSYFWHRILKQFKVDYVDHERPKDEHNEVEGKWKERLM
jgi:hypothetical protein